ncbi:MAG: TlpA disulfide reductase family protein [Acidimicrobiales bacterium]|nr:TlpA disulfide reductase family protein [Acidimicrobiales bacterium]
MQRLPDSAVSTHQPARIGAAAIIVAVVTIGTLFGCATKAPIDVTSMPFELWAGGKTTLDDLIDENQRPIVVNLWATWCTPCLEEMPVLQAAHKAISDQVQFVGINISDSPTRAGQRVNELGITYLQGRDPTGEFSAALSTVGLPVTAFVNAGGDLVATHHGSLDAEELNTAILKHLEPIR